MDAKNTNGWILGWLIVHSIILVVVFSFMLMVPMTYQKRVDEMAILLHQRISELVTRVDSQQEAITNLKIQYDPHKRLSELETWQRTFCTAKKIEACALLGKVKR